MKHINIIIVGYNEEINLPKLFKSLVYLNNISKRVIYIDQSSLDESIKIAKSYGAEVFVHENKGYPEPDKKWAVENLIKDDELCLFLDADEEITGELAGEIMNFSGEVANIKIPLYFMGKIVQSSAQLRLFKKRSIKISDKIHSYISSINKEVYLFKNPIINIDKKSIGKEIQILTQKVNSYSDKEIRGDGKILTILKIIYMPLLGFLHFWLLNRNFLNGIPGFICSIIMGYYQFLIYTKHYEKLNKDNF